ncbi:MAG: thiamine pyrophosphate-binding protein [Desulfobacterales bacterium]|jgi:acetolactate synthase-1/2/3 large subunit
MTTETVAGAKLVADALVARGVDTIFTLSGGHITPIYQYLEDTDVALFDTRHEQAALFMAEAWGKMTRQPGVAMVTAGPGFTNALTGIASAYFSNTPLVMIAGCVGLDHKEKLDLQDMAQAPVIDPMVKRTLVCQKPERAAEYVDLAFRTAASGRPGPVYLEFPVDVLNAHVNPADVRQPITEIDSRPADLENTHKMMAWLGEARKPVVIAGSGVWHAHAEDALVEFTEKAGVPVFTSLSGRGTISDTHPLCFESALAIRPGGAFAAYIETDLVILLGTRVGLYYIFGDIFNPEARMVQVDIMPEEIGRNRRIDLPIVSDARAFLRECCRTMDAADGGMDLRKRFQQWVTTIAVADETGKAQARPNWESDAHPIHPLRLAREIDAFMDREDDIVVADGGDTTTWIGMTRTIRKPGRYLDYGIYGSLGVGLPYALAAKWRYPEQRVCLLTGDGSVGFNFMEIENAIRKGLALVVVISNDLGWGMIRHSQELRIGHAIEEGTFIGRVDYHKLAEALGGLGFAVEEAKDIRPALEAAFASGKTCFINVMTDPTTVSPGSVALANLGGYKAT